MEITGILHCHSTYSYDGKLSLRELRTLLLAEGHSFVCMSEHTDELTQEAAEAFVIECQTLSDEAFVFVPGFEVPYKRAHVLLYGCTEFFGQEAADAASLRDAASAAEFVVLAHPVRNKFMLDEHLTSVIDGVEIWNQQYDGKPMARPRSAKLLQQLRATRPELLAVGGLDVHRQEHIGNPYVQLEVAELTAEEILKALTSGSYFFGTDYFQIDAMANWQPTISETTKSSGAIAVIMVGKLVNKSLAAIGLSFPRSLTQLIRRFV